MDNAPPDVSSGCGLLLLPNGHGLVSFLTGSWYDVAFAPGGNASWAPNITSFPAEVAVNTTVTLAGTQLCGLSECYSEGDDSQAAENYPMVRFVDSKGGVTYARAHDVSTRSIAPGQPGTVLVDIPASLALGAYSVQVVAIGIPSGPGTTVNVVVPSAVPPVISSIDPSTGSTLGGTHVLIQGSDLESTAAVFFGGEPAGFTNLGQGTIGATAPPANVGPVTIFVHTGAGVSSANSAAVFTYVFFPGVASITVSPNVLWTGSSATGTITLDEPAPSGGMTVTLVSSPTGVAVPASVFISGGGTSATFPIVTSATAMTGTATITASLPDGATQSTTVEISTGQVWLSVTSSTALPPLFPGSGPTGVLEAGQPVTLTIYVRTPAPPFFGGTITLSATGTNAGVFGMPPSLPLGAGATSAQVTLTPTLGSVLRGSLTITANYEGNSGTIVLSIGTSLSHPPPPPPPPHGGPI